MRYIVYRLDVRNISGSEIHINEKTFLDEVEGQSRFISHEDAMERIEELQKEEVQNYTILTVY